MSTTSERLFVAKENLVVAKERCEALTIALEQVERLEGILQDCNSSLALLRNQLSGSHSDGIRHQISQKENDLMILEIASSVIYRVMECWPK